MDKNEDGKVCKDEAVGRMKEHFAKLDKNKDGAVTVEELKAAFAARAKAIKEAREKKGGCEKPKCPKKPQCPSKK